MSNRRTVTYQTWFGMKARCLNPRHTFYANYGSRGITVCERWLAFDNFLTDMGERPEGMTLDRIETDGNYEPSNCRWASRHDQNNNARSNTLTTINGRTQNSAQWAREIGISDKAFRARLKRGDTGEKLLRPLVESSQPTVLVEINGITRPLTEWAALHGLRYNTVYRRYARGARGIALLAPRSGKGWPAGKPRHVNSPAE